MPAPSDPAKHWLGKLTHLRTAYTPGLGVAPHKPLLIFSVMDLIGSGDLTSPWIHYNAALVTRFRDYWDLVVDRRKNHPDIPMPFNALGSDRDAIWERFDENGNPSFSKLTTRNARMDSGLFACMTDPGFRRAARTAMTVKYFTPAEQVGLCERFRIPLPDSAEMAAFAQQSDAFKASQKKGRTNRFKAEVGSGYKYTCSLTGYCLQTGAGYLVQAAHIHQHAKSGNDDSRNGLALSPDAHWMFDAGLWTVAPKDDHLLIEVAFNKFTESSPHGRLLATLHQTPLHFHPQARLRPDPKHFDWHRQIHGF